MFELQMLKLWYADICSQCDESFEGKYILH